MVVPATLEVAAKVVSITLSYASQEDSGNLSNEVPFFHETPPVVLIRYHFIEMFLAPIN